MNKKYIGIGLTVLSALGIGIYFNYQNNHNDDIPVIQAKHITSQDFNLEKSNEIIKKQEEKQKHLPPYYTVKLKDIPYDKHRTGKKVLVDGIEYEDYAGYLVPPEPDKELNNSTLFGVDVNNNFVRDDIERKIIFHRGFDVSTKGLLLQGVRTKTFLMPGGKLENSTNGADLLLKISNMNDYNGDASGDFIANTKERKRAIRFINMGQSGGSTVVIDSNYFTKKHYRDFTVDDMENIRDRDKGTFHGYKWSMDAYKDEPFPVYDMYGHIDGYYYHGEKRRVRGVEFCELNYQINDYQECRRHIKELQKSYGKMSTEELIEKGLIDG